MANLSVLTFSRTAHCQYGAVFYDVASAVDRFLSVSVHGLVRTALQLLNSCNKLTPSYHVVRAQKYLCTYSKNLKATTEPYRANRPIRSASLVVGLYQSATHRSHVAVLARDRFTY